MRSTVSLFLPRTRVHLKDFAAHLESNPEKFGLLPNTLIQDDTKVAFKVKKESATFSCVYYLPGLFVVETNEDASTGAFLFLFAKAFFSEVVVIWPSATASLKDGSLALGISEASSAGGTQESMVTACLDFVEKAVSMVRETPRGREQLQLQYLLATETRQRILQTLTSLNVFNSAISPIDPKLMAVGTGQIEFASRFIDARISRLEFELQGQIGRKLTRLNWLVVVLTVMLIVFTTLALLKG
jgi:hypothetical protein